MGEEIKTGQVETASSALGRRESQGGTHLCSNQPGLSGSHTCTNTFSPLMLGDHASVPALSVPYYPLKLEATCASLLTSSRRHGA